MTSDKFWRNAAAYMLGTAVLKLLPLLLVPIMARFLGADELGLYELATSYALVLQSVATLSLETAVVRFLFRDPSDAARSRLISNSLYSTVGVAALIGVLLVSAPQWIAETFLGSRSHSDIVLVVAGLVLTAGLFNFAVTIFQYLGKVRRYLELSVGFGLGTGAITLGIVVILGGGVEAVLLAQLALNGFGAILVIALLYRNGLFGARIDLAYWCELLRFSLPILAAVLLMWTTTYGSRALSVAYLSAADIGIMSAAMRLASVVKLLDEGLKMVWSPFVYSNLEMEGHQAEFRDKFTRITILSFAGGIVLLLFSVELFELLLPPVYAGGRVAFCIFVTAFCIASSHQLVSIGATIRERTWLSTIVFALGAVVSLGTTMTLIDHFGIAAVPAGLFASAVVMVVTGWYITERIYPIGYPRISYAICLITLLSICAVSILVEGHFGLRFVAAAITIVAAAIGASTRHTAQKALFRERISAE